MGGELDGLGAGDLVRQARRVADLSQRELANRAGVRRQVVERIESGETSGPRWSTVIELLAAAGCTVALQPGSAPAPPPPPPSDLRDRAGRHFPAHLDTRPVDAFGSWWGDWPLLSTRAERIWRWAPRQRPDHTFDLARWRRDARRAGDYAPGEPEAPGDDAPHDEESASD